MSTPLVTIVTPTYNRPTMFAECADSVLAQTFTDWTWWVVLNCERWPKGYSSSNDPRVHTLWYSVPEAYRRGFHIPAQIVNWLYPKVTTPYIYFLADDDLIDPDGLGVLVAKMNPKPYYGTPENEDYWVEAAYGRCEVVDQQSDGSFAHAAWCYPGDPVQEAADISVHISGADCYDVGLGTAVQPHCLLDGGQVLHTKALWDRATADGWQLTDSPDSAAANDGILLNRLAEFARFHYVPQRIVTHRRHTGATHHRPRGIE